MFCWFSTPLDFRSAVFAEAAGHLFLLSGWMYLSEDINNHKRSHASCISSHLSLSRASGEHAVHSNNWWKQRQSIAVLVKLCTRVARTCSTCTPLAFARTLLPWRSVLVPITDNNCRQSPCVSITSRHNALIRPGLISPSGSSHSKNDLYCVSCLEQMKSVAQINTGFS